MNDGIIIFDKPVGFSSFQVVRILQHHHKKVGHAGTLDPFASGLLIILIGSETKKCESIQKLDKEYVGEMALGISTNTYDISGDEVDLFRKESSNFENFILQKFNKLAKKFTGEIEQRPPKFSALKQNGQKLYELSRRGIEVLPKSRKVFVKSFKIIACQYPVLKFSAVVGKGVYIRSLANDFGALLGCGATLVSLRRLRIGDYDVSRAKKLGDILSLGSP